MSATCQSWAERYIGRGASRVQYAGNCVLERGHDGDHLPHTLQAKQSYDQAFNDGLSVAISVIDSVMRTLDPDSTIVGRATITRITEALAEAKR